MTSAERDVQVPDEAPMDAPLIFGEAYAEDSFRTTSTCQDKGAPTTTEPCATAVNDPPVVTGDAHLSPLAPPRSSPPVEEATAAVEEEGDSHIVTTPTETMEDDNPQQPSVILSDAVAAPTVAATAEVDTAMATVIAPISAITTAPAMTTVASPFMCEAIRHPCGRLHEDAEAGTEERVGTKRQRSLSEPAAPSPAAVVVSERPVRVAESIDLIESRVRAVMSTLTESLPRFTASIVKMSEGDSAPRLLPPEIEASALALPAQIAAVAAAVRVAKACGSERDAEECREGLANLAELGSHCWNQTTYLFSQHGPPPGLLVLDGPKTSAEGTETEENGALHQAISACGSLDLGGGWAGSQAAAALATYRTAKALARAISGELVTISAGGSTPRQAVEGLLLSVRVGRELYAAALARYDAEGPRNAQCTALMAAADKWFAKTLTYFRGEGAVVLAKAVPDGSAATTQIATQATMAVSEAATELFGFTLATEYHRHQRAGDATGRGRTLRAFTGGLLSARRQLQAATAAAKVGAPLLVSARVRGVAIALHAVWCYTVEHQPELRIPRVFFTRQDSFLPALKAADAVPELAHAWIEATSALARDGSHQLSEIAGGVAEEGALVPRAVFSLVEAWACAAHALLCHTTRPEEALTKLSDARTQLRDAAWEQLLVSSGVNVEETSRPLTASVGRVGWERPLYVRLCGGLLLTAGRLNVGCCGLEAMLRATSGGGNDSAFASALATGRHFLLRVMVPVGLSVAGRGRDKPHPYDRCPLTSLFAAAESLSAASSRCAALVGQDPVAAACQPLVPVLRELLHTQLATDQHVPRAVAHIVSALVQGALDEASAALRRAKQRTDAPNGSSISMASAAEAVGSAAAVVSTVLRGVGLLQDGPRTGHPSGPRMAQDQIATWPGPAHEIFATPARDDIRRYLLSTISRSLFSWLAHFGQGLLQALALDAVTTQPPPPSAGVPAEDAAARDRIVLVAVHVLSAAARIAETPEHTNVSGGNANTAAKPSRAADPDEFVTVLRLQARALCAWFGAAAHPAPTHAALADLLAGVVQCIRLERATVQFDFENSRQAAMDGALALLAAVTRPAGPGGRSGQSSVRALLRGASPLTLLLLTDAVFMCARGEEHNSANAGTAAVLSSIIAEMADYQPTNPAAAGSAHCLEIAAHLAAGRGYAPVVVQAAVLLFEGLVGEGGLRADATAAGWSPARTAAIAGIVLPCAVSAAPEQLVPLAETVAALLHSALHHNTTTAPTAADAAACAATIHNTAIDERVPPVVAMTLILIATDIAPPTMASNGAADGCDGLRPSLLRAACSAVARLAFAAGASAAAFNATVPPALPVMRRWLESCHGLIAECCPSTSGTSKVHTVAARELERVAMLATGACLVCLAGPSHPSEGALGRARLVADRLTQLAASPEEAAADCASLGTLAAHGGSTVLEVLFVERATALQVASLRIHNGTLIGDLKTHSDAALTAAQFATELHAVCSTRHEQLYALRCVAAALRAGFPSRPIPSDNDSAAQWVPMVQFAAIEAWNHAIFVASFDDGDGADPLHLSDNAAGDGSLSDEGLWAVLSDPKELRSPWDGPSAAGAGVPPLLSGHRAWQALAFGLVEYLPPMDSVRGTIQLQRL